MFYPSPIDCISRETTEEAETLAIMALPMCTWQVVDSEAW